ncbi:MAG: hypothetical protein HKN23_09330 [Verrucomicrobiales bacterium]|nr:hypothetical protein [Verrucomicrobiales bacterium]
MNQNEISVPRDQLESKVKSPGIAAVLSALLPGLGQVYNGRFIWAIVWFIITPGLWIGSGGFLGWVCHILSALQAYSYAKRKLEGD